MRKSSRRPIGGNVFKAVTPVSWNLRTESGKLHGRLALRDLTSGRHLVFEPMKKPLHGHAVLYESLPERLYLRGSLYRLLQNDRRSSAYHVGAVIVPDYMAVNMIIQG